MRVLGGHKPLRLTEISTNLVGHMLKNALEKYGETEAKNQLKNIGPSIVENILFGLTENKEIWDEIFPIFCTQNITKLIMEWNLKMIPLISELKNLKQIYITGFSRSITASELRKYFGHILSVDFDGELIWREVSNYSYVEIQIQEESWLASTQNIIRHMVTSHRKIPKYLTNTELQGLVELHLNNVNITWSEIVIILENEPNLTILRNYQLLKALYQMHNLEFKNGSLKKRYYLRNVDADFSYVGRCTLEVERMLPFDALNIAVMACPNCYMVKVRLDCSTHHDILLPLVNLKQLKELSVVCVTNGERSLLDFTDINPIIEHHGSSLKALELKVIDEVDTHVLTHKCPKLETLILSGCNYVSPFTCSLYECYQKSTELKKLKIFFFAEGGDVIDNSNVPNCFWYSILYSSVAPSKLTAIFLESPRIPESVADQLFGRCGQSIYPNLTIASFCEYDELTVAQLLTITSSAKSLNYLRLSNCRNFRLNDVKLWQSVSGRFDVIVVCD